MMINIINKFNPLNILLNPMMILVGDILMIASGLTVAYYVRMVLLWIK